jgi:putative inorganic carbon (HCO3(-)) transporter
MAVLGAEIALLFPRRWFPYLFAIGLIAFLVMCALFGEKMDASAQGRVVFWGLANQMFKHNPIFGIGYEMAWMCTDKGMALHNAFVTCYTELGLFGYWFWFLLIQVGVIGAMRVRKILQFVDDPDAQWIRRLAKHTICAMFGFCASAYFLSRTFIYPLFFLMAMLGVIPLLARPYMPPNMPLLFEKRRDLYRNGTIGVLISVVYIYISIVLLNLSYYG